MAVTRQAREPGHELTPSERRVALLAVRGLTNRAISTELGVTQRTVELHLTSAYRKLGVAGRSELAGAVSPPPDQDPAAGVRA